MLARGERKAWWRKAERERMAVVERRRMVGEIEAIDSMGWDADILAVHQYSYCTVL